MFRDKWIVAFGLGVVLGSVGFYLFEGGLSKSVSDEELISEYYKVEALVSVSPYDIKTALQRGTHNEFVLVDLRTQAEYDQEHITSAVNVPSYSPSDATGETSEERIVKAFEQIIANNPGKDIITYCYSAACMASRKVGNMLAQHGIYTKHLNIGWYEWKYYWTMWNGEDGNRAEDFITTGSEPGEPEIGGPIDPCGEGEFSC